MISKNLLYVAMLCLLNGICIDFCAGEKGKQGGMTFDSLPHELLPIIAAISDCKTIRRCKLVCKKFDKAFDYKYIHPHIIEGEDYDLCTHGLIYYAQTDKLDNFEALAHNNYGQRVADIALLGLGKNPSLQACMRVYKKEQGLYSVSPDFLFAMLSTPADLKRIMPFINLNAQDACGFTLVDFASRDNDVELVKLLVANEKTDLDIQNIDGIPFIAKCVAATIVIGTAYFGGCLAIIMS